VKKRVNKGHNFFHAWELRLSFVRLFDL